MLEGLLASFAEHYFRTEDEESRPHALRVRAEILRMAIDEFAETLRRLKIPGETTAETLRHYQSDHGPLRA